MTAGSAPGCVVLGGSGHARVVIDTLRAAGTANPVAVLEMDSRLWGALVLDVLVRGGDDLLPSLRGEGITCFAVGIAGTGDNGPRARLYELALANGLRPVSVIHPSAICSPWAQVGEGAQLLAASVVNAGARLGVNVIANTASVIEHDCVIADHVHIASGACVLGGVRVGRCAHVGGGATVRQQIAIGEGAVVAAGATVVADVDAHVVVAGTPARILRKTEGSAS